MSSGLHFWRKCQEEKIIPHKIFYKDTIHISLDLIRKPEISAQKFWRRKSDAVLYNINVVT